MHSINTLTHAVFPYFFHFLNYYYYYYLWWFFFLTNRVSFVFLFSFFPFPKRSVYKSVEFVAWFFLFFPTFPFIFTIFIVHHHLSLRSTLLFFFHFLTFQTSPLKANEWSFSLSITGETSLNQQARKMTKTRSTGQYFFLFPHNITIFLDSRVLGAVPVLRGDRGGGGERRDDD